MPFEHCGLKISQKDYLIEVIANCQNVAICYLVKYSRICRNNELPKSHPLK